MIKRVIKEIATGAENLLSLFGCPNKLEVSTPFDHVLTQYLAKNDPKDFFFVQIGAHNGIANDPIRKYVFKYGLRGILLEPQKEIFASLLENYKEHPQLIFENVAISDKNETKSLYKIRSHAQNLPKWADQLASFSKQTILCHGDVIPNIASLIDVANVQCITLYALLDKYEIADVDLLQIDAEGYDYEIIKTIDFDKVKPRMIHFEHKHLNARDTGNCVKFLMKNGYQITFSGSDAIAYTPGRTICK
jgi:FkbM family methyltransferase